MAFKLNLDLRFLEHALQIIAMGIVTTAAFITALIADIKMAKFSDAEVLVIRGAAAVINQDDPSFKIDAASGLVYAIIGVVGVTGGILIFENIFKSRHIRLSQRIFTLMYMLLLLVCCLVFFADAVVGMVTSVDLSNLLSNALSRIILDNGGVTSNITIIRNSVAALSAFSLLASVLFVCLEAIVVVSCFVFKDNTQYSIF